MRTLVWTLVLMLVAAYAQAQDVGREQISFSGKSTFSKDYLRSIQ